MEKNLVRERKWVEYCVYPLSSPQSLIAEGSANFGIDVAFPGGERAAFERERLFPLAGFEPRRAEEYYRVHAVTLRLHYAGNEAARGYLDGAMSKDDAVDWLVTYGLYSRERAEQRIRFIEKYRSYVINYNLGLDIVRDWVDRQGGTATQPEKRWEVFRRLLSNPYTPSALR